MTSPDYRRIQEDFLKGFSESSERLAKGWGKSLEQTAFQNLVPKLEKPSTGGVDLSAFRRALDFSSAGEKLLETIDRAAKDLPDLLEPRRDKPRTQAIADKWIKSYEEFAREMVGLPKISHTDRWLKHWNSYLESFSGKGLGKSFGNRLEPFPWLLAANPLGMPFGTGEWFRYWTETYRMTMGKAYPMPGLELIREYEEMAKKAMAAQMKFIRTLPDLQEHLNKASKKAVETIIEDIGKMEVKTPDTETYKRFYEGWLEVNEKTFLELFKSESFGRAFSESRKRGLDARTKMDPIMMDWLSFINVASGKEVDELQDDLLSMREQVRTLQEEVSEMRRMIESTTQLSPDNEGDGA
ncbi:poly(R)-hydroxyalkanoic acid synthase subunit PhaE [Thermodesulfobacteriota bacterium]